MSRNEASPTVLSKLIEHDYNDNNDLQEYNTSDHDTRITTIDKAKQCEVNSSGRKDDDKNSQNKMAAAADGIYSPKMETYAESRLGVEEDEEVLVTKEVQVEGDKKKVTYTRKTSVPAFMNKTKLNGHCHSDTPIATQDKKSRNKLILASVLCLIFMIVEIVGGYLAGSLAIISDAAHLLTDFASFMISLVAIYLASRPATRRFNYGWHRAEILGAFTSVIMLWILTGVLAYEAVMRVITEDYEIDSEIMLITAGIGVAFNLILGTTLHQHGHSHGGGGHGHSHGGSSSSSSKGHGHSHSKGGKRAAGGVKENGQHHHAHNRQQQKHTGDGHNEQKKQNQSPDSIMMYSSGKFNYGSTDPTNKLDNANVEISIEPHHDQGHGHSHGHVKKEKNINVKAAFIHVVGDLLQSVGVLVAAFLIYFKPEWKMADPICTFVFSIIVVVTTATIMRDIIVVLMEGKPRGIDFTDVRETLLSVASVKDTHNLRMWSLTMDKIALSVHLVVEDECDAHVVLKEASDVLRSQFHILDITIQIEEYVQDMDDCHGCVEPS